MSEASEQLDLVNAEIRRRLGAGGTEEWSEGGQRWRVTSTRELYEIRDKLQAEVAYESGSAFKLVQFDPRLG